MKILLAPSETKVRGGDGVFDLGSLIFGELFAVRASLVDAYMEVLRRGDNTELSEMFGLTQKPDISYHASREILCEPTMKAIERYAGVVFDYLDYQSLDKEAKRYLHEHLVIHSNLFGFLRADDMIPEYRLKQGMPIGNISTEKLYREAGSPLMDAYTNGEDILDLRARFYDKFYKPSSPTTVLKFLKNGKVVSYWAKAYRGLVLRAIAQAGIKSIDEFMKLPINGLTIAEIQTRKSHTEIIYQIDPI